MPKVYSVDNAIEKNRPYIELRGKLYAVRDITVRERLEKISEFKKKQREAEKRTGKDSDEIEFEDIQEVVASAVQKALVGVPDEIANSLTEREWQLIQTAIVEIQQNEFPIDVSDVDELDPNRIGQTVD